MMASAQWSIEDGPLAEGGTQVLFTATRAGYRHFSILVQGEGGLSITQIPVETAILEPNSEELRSRRNLDPDAIAHNMGLLGGGPKLGAGESPLSIELEAGGYSLGRGRGASPIERVSGHDFARLGVLTEQLLADDPETSLLVVSASPEVRLGALVEAVAVGRKYLPRVVVQYEAAQGHGG